MKKKPPGKPRKVRKKIREDLIWRRAGVNEDKDEEEGGLPKKMIKSTVDLAS